MKTNATKAPVPVNPGTKTGEKNGETKAKKSKSAKANKD